MNLEIWPYGSLTWAKQVADAPHAHSTPDLRTALARLMRTQSNGGVRGSEKARRRLAERLAALRTALAGIESNPWTAYYSAFAAIKPKMKAFTEAIASQFDATVEEDDNSEDVGFVTSFDVAGIKYYLEFQLWDAGTSSGDAEPGECGAVRLSVCREGGQIVVGWSPYNYTEKVWIPYSDTAEFLARIPEVEEAESVVKAIREDAATGKESA